MSLSSSRRSSTRSSASRFSLLRAWPAHAAIENVVSGQRANRFHERRTEEPQLLAFARNGRADAESRAVRRQPRFAFVRTEMSTRSLGTVTFLEKSLSRRKTLALGTLAIPARMVDRAVNFDGCFGWSWHRQSFFALSAAGNQWRQALAPAIGVIALKTCRRRQDISGQRASLGSLSI